MSEENVVVDNTPALNGGADQTAVEQVTATSSTAEAGEPSTEAKGKDGEANKAKTEGAPEKYEEFKIADGLELDAKAMDAFKEFAKGRNWSQKDAQEIIDFQNKIELERAKQSAEAWKTIQEGWRKSAKEDKEFGGDAYDENLALANKAAAAIGDDEFFQMLVETGVGDHPAMIRAFVRLGKKMSNDKLVFGNGSEQKKSLAERLFTSMAEKE